MAAGLIVAPPLLVATDTDTETEIETETEKESGIGRGKEKERGRGIERGRGSGRGRGRGRGREESGRERGRGRGREIDVLGDAVERDAGLCLPVLTTHLPEDQGMQQFCAYIHVLLCYIVQVYSYCSRHSCSNKCLFCNYHFFTENELSVAVFEV